jgi:NADPH:quinone reductase-like Zn-dependent oxidoreductase
MRAILLFRYGGVDQLGLREVPGPRPEAGQVLVRVVATSVNPIDWKMRSGAAKARFPVEMPAILGRDLSGIVLEPAAGFAKGERVMGLVWHTYAEELVCPANVLARLPDGLDPHVAGALPLVLTTGSQLVDQAEVQSNETVLVTGALGGVGRTAVFVALRRGAKVLAGVRKSQREEAKALKAHGVFALDDDADVNALPELDRIADTVGGDTIAKLLKRLRKGGTLGSVVGGSEAAKERGVKVNAFMAHPDPAVLRDLAEALVRGELEIPIVKRFPLEQTAEAQAVAEKGAGGKVLIVP